MTEPEHIDLMTPAGRLVHTTDLDRALEVLRSAETLSLYLTVTFATCFVTDVQARWQEERKVPINPWGDRSRPAGLLVADTARLGGLGPALVALCDGIEDLSKGLHYDGPENPLSVDLHFPGVPASTALDPAERRFVLDHVRRLAGLSPGDQAVVDRIVTKLAATLQSEDDDDN